MTMQVRCRRQLAHACAAAACVRVHARAPRADWGARAFRLPRADARSHPYIPRSTMRLRLQGKVFSTVCRPRTNVPALLTSDRSAGGRRHGRGGARNVPAAVPRHFHCEAARVLRVCGAHRHARLYAGR